MAVARAAVIKPGLGYPMSMRSAGIACLLLLVSGVMCVEI